MARVDMASIASRPQCRLQQSLQMHLSHCKKIVAMPTSRSRGASAAEPINLFVFVLATPMC
jgi:hypothetical protein